MGHYRKARAGCQPDTPARQEQTTPPDAAAPTTLATRYGAAILAGGHTSLPTYAWVYYARLGVSEAEMVCIAQLCTYWWTERDPYPGEAALATRMGKTIRTVQGYLRSLEGKGLLHIHTQFSARGRQATNAYDLRPFFAAVEGLARLDGLLINVAPAPPTTDDVAPTVLAPRVTAALPTVRPAEQEPLCAGQSAGEGRGEGSREGGAKDSSPQVDPIEEDLFDLDSTPLTPIEATRTALADDQRVPVVCGPDDQALTHRIADLSRELGDDAPASSLTRAQSLGYAAGVSPARLLQFLDAAAARTRARQAHIVKRRRDGRAVNGMPYLFAVLADLLHPAPPGTRTTPDRRRAARHRQPEAAPVPVDYVAWTGAAAAPDAGDLTVAPPEQNPTWRRALDELSNDMLRENYVRWFGPTRVISDDGALLCIAVPDAFHQQWLDRRLRPVVERALARIAAGLRVEFVVEVAA